jgi:lipoprotein NlpD
MAAAGRAGAPGRHALGAAGVVVLLFLLAACAGRPPAPIEDRSRGGTARPEEGYTVLRGDTLYSIAFRYGLDYRGLAAANGIVAPYTIYPGQRLRLREASVRDSGRSAPAPATPVVATPRATPAAASDTTVRATPPAPKATPVPTVPVPPQAEAGWRWPAAGRVTRGFDGALHKGIDIAGSRGDPVVAAAGGRVVYAGSGIAGYGLMVILRHTDDYLSAYGHNDELLVAEGDTVRAGAPIARRGSSGTDAVKLHFEIRRQGRPVDPRGLLPPR